MSEPDYLAIIERRFAWIGDAPPAFGMSLRDCFAGQIAAGMAAHSGTAGISFGPHDIAGRAYQVADAMLAARMPLPTPPAPAYPPPPSEDDKRARRDYELTRPQLPPPAPAGGENGQ